MKRWMTLLLSAVLLLAASSAGAETEQGKKLDDATEVLRQFVNIPENAIPKALLNQAYGIAVIPSVLKIGFVFGGRRGSGVLAVRTDNGGWSNPIFINLTGVSFGFQAGASSTDIILVFKTQRSVEAAANGQFTLGADASVAAGPIGRHAGAATSANLHAEVYSYSRSRGLFAGASLEGAHIGVDHDADWLFYNQAGLDAKTILQNGDHADIPKPGQRFVYTLNRYMPPSNNKFSYSANIDGDHRNTDAAGANGDSGDAGQTSPYHGSGGSVSVQSGATGRPSTARPGNANNGNTHPSTARMGNARTSHDYGSGTDNNY